MNLFLPSLALLTYTKPLGERREKKRIERE